MDRPFRITFSSSSVPRRLTFADGNSFPQGYIAFYFQTKFSETPLKLCSTDPQASGGLALVIHSLGQKVLVGFLYFVQALGSEVVPK